MLSRESPHPQKEGLKAVKVITPTYNFLTYVSAAKNKNTHNKKIVQKRDSLFSGMDKGGVKKDFREQLMPTWL